LAIFHENVLGYCSDCGNTSNSLTVIEMVDDGDSLAFCPKCLSEMVLRLNNRSADKWLDDEMS
jgi:hypothetical protein